MIVGITDDVLFHVLVGGVERRLVLHPERQREAGAEVVIECRLGHDRRVAGAVELVDLVALVTLVGAQVARPVRTG